MFRDSDLIEYKLCMSGCSVDPVFADYQQLPGPIIGFKVGTKDVNTSSLFDHPVEVSLIYNSCPCPATSFTGGIAPSDMTARVGDSAAITQTLQYQTNSMEL